MRARLVVPLAALSLVACSAVTAIVADKPYDPLPLPVPTPVLDTTLRIFVIGDAGELGTIHDADWNAMKAYLAKGGSVPAVLLIPGDVSYPKGLPDQCGDAWNVLQEEYLKPTPGGVQIYSVPGNHDHGDKDFGTNFDIAWRAAYFDCEQQEYVATQIGWGPKACPCDKRWHVPTGAGTIAAHTLLPAVAGLGDEPGALQRSHVLVHRGEADRIAAGQVGDRVGVPQHDGEDVAARGIGQRMEERVGPLGLRQTYNHSVVG